jgi:hypothetical protein
MQTPINPAEVNKIAESQARNTYQHMCRMERRWRVASCVQLGGGECASGHKPYVPVGYLGLGDLK